MKRILLLILVLGAIIIAGCSSGKVTDNGVANNGGNSITVYKSPNCGCCVGYIAELEKQGFHVKTVEMQNTYSIKEKYNVPQTMQSCHTAVIGGYFVEGHVPIEAIDKMLEEKPDIDGIALPRMPSGSPGMPGAKTELWTIYAVNNGKITEFMVI